MNMKESSSSVTSCIGSKKSWIGGTFAMFIEMTFVHLKSYEPSFQVVSPYVCVYFLGLCLDVHPQWSREDVQTIQNFNIYFKRIDLQKHISNLFIKQETKVASKE